MRHSLRQYEELQSTRCLLRLVAAGVCAWIPVSIVNAQEARSRFPLNPTQIVSVMQDRQLPSRGAKISLAAAITAAIADPPLEIRSITLLSAREMRLRMACKDHSQCLPFFAVATYSEDVKPADFSMKPEQQPTGGDQALVASRPAAQASAVPASAKAAAAREAPMLHSGTSAALDFDGDRVHVRVQVICLESGSAGDKIRVTSRDRKQVYVAEIVTPTVLKGTF